jgi:hypothetical protein
VGGFFFLGGGATPHFFLFVDGGGAAPHAPFTVQLDDFRMIAEAMWIGLLEWSGAVHYLRNASSIHSLLCIHIVFVRGVC